MTTYTLAVFNDSPDYIHRFLSYCREHDTSFDVYGFTDPQALNDHVSDCGIDILLLPRDSTLTEQINTESGKIREIVYLGEQQDLYSDVKELNMFQPMGAILKDLASVASELSPASFQSSSDTEIIGIYLLDGSGNAGDLAMLLSESAEHKGKRTLYADLDRFSGFARQHGFSSPGSISDLIYYFRSGVGISAAAMKDLCQTVGSLQYLAPPVSGSDPDEVPAGQWNTFLGMVADAGSINTVIINLKSYCQDFLHLFSICRKIYLLTDSYQTAISGDLISGAGSFRAKAFHDYFLHNDRPDILRKIEDGNLKAASLTQAAQNTSGRSGLFRNRWKRTN